MAYINDEVLDVIENKLGMLDSEGLYPFCNRVTLDSIGIDPRDIADTLGAFLMNMFNDDTNAIVNCLFESGFRKWEGLDEMNRTIAEGRETDDFYFKELGSLYYSYSVEGLLSSDLQNRVEIDLDYVYQKSDYHYGVYTRTIEMYPKPFINSEVRTNEIPKNLVDTLYIGLYKEFEGFSKKDQFHYMCNPEQESSYLASSNWKNAYYTTIKEAGDQHYHNTGKDIFNSTDYWVVGTALPKEIVDKYNLPIKN